MRIDELYFREVGPFDELHLEFRPRAREDRADVAVLTGPNGCGKSTILYAIATLFASGSKHLVLPHLKPRLRTTSALALMRSGKFVTAATPGEPLNMANPVFDPKSFATHTLEHSLHHYHSSSQGPFQAYIRALSSQQGPQPTRFSYAAFAYAGARTCDPTLLTAIAEPTDPPLEGSLAFSTQNQAQRLAQWLANNDYKVLGFRNDGDLAAAARFERGQKDIETAVSQVVGEDIRFVIRRDPLAVLVRFGGRDMGFAVLPDGLKSILSWIADVLMRLERLPWVDDVPPLQRPFLLLLDEIDIHLHPRWQRRVLPFVQQLFPKAQVIVSTHSPFVVTSITDAWIYSFAVADGRATLRDVTPSKAGTSYMAALRSVFQVGEEFDEDTERRLADLQNLRDRVLRGEVGIEDLRALAVELESRGPEVAEIVSFEVRQVERRLRQAQPQ